MSLPHRDEWNADGRGFRRFERTVRVGAGDAAWRRARTDLLAWRVKTRSGFRVVPDVPPAVDGRHWLEIGFGPLTLREPVEVVAFVDEPDRVGYVYLALPGHPLEGEETFLITRRGDEVLFTLRSLSRPAPTWFWRLAYPAVRVVQVIVRTRYLSALRRGDHSAGPLSH
ncbi:DUF1990 family protein [Microbacterium arborescens]|jgi:uncharacterized protein (UPF0548 family)|uniref:DUF1990 family protein n=1 Tax=Microbacterium arborescens TaxID=33883 RepID=UPI00259FFE9E|nr:DUF1990 domain-containing protein [Microbacterium arborescens]WJM15643.1 DUF1990 domain-containing protein [Microbacterium arborescens]